jgi:hypothetical protein
LNPSSTRSAVKAFPRGGRLVSIKDSVKENNRVGLCTQESFFLEKLILKPTTFRREKKGTVRTDLY